MVIHFDITIPARSLRATERKASAPMQTSALLTAAQAQIEDFLSELARLVKKIVLILHPVLYCIKNQFILYENTVMVFHTGKQLCWHN